MRAVSDRYIKTYTALKKVKLYTKRKPRQKALALYSYFNIFAT